MSPYERIKIRYNVDYHKVIDRKTREALQNVVWIDEESKEYAQVINDKISILTGDVMLCPKRCRDRRQEDRRQAPRRTRSRRD